MALTRLKSIDFAAMRLPYITISYPLYPIPETTIPYLLYPIPY